VVQLRRENKEGTEMNMVGFQTRLKWREQKRVFRMLPGMERAEFSRYGVMHKNFYINSPKLLTPGLRSKKHETLWFAGQIVGVEGYLESAAMGLVAALNMLSYVKKGKEVVFPWETAIGALQKHVYDPYSKKNFQPANITFGLFKTLKNIPWRKQRRRAYYVRAMEFTEKMIEEIREEYGEG
jgi:methylenetetrahydrofolate--tRNA-(uracil-5-)-methyltransferase